MPNDSAVVPSSIHASEFKINEHCCDNNPGTKLLKIKIPCIRKAYLNGYETGLTNHRVKSENFELDLTEKLALSWLDGWLDGIECVEKQCSEHALGQVMETAHAWG